MLLAGRPPYSHASLLEAGHPGPLPSVSTPDRPFSAEVDAVLHRGLAHDREERFPSVTGFVTALESALVSSLGPAAVGPAVTSAWIPVDPELTQPGPRPTSSPGAGEPLPDLTTQRRPRRLRKVLVGTLVAAVALGIGGAAGYALEGLGAPTQRTFSDADGALAVTVPADWDRADADQGWTPPNAEDPSGVYPALSVGTSSTWWETGSTGHGVFVGLLPGSEIPVQLPQHPECDQAGAATRNTISEPTATVVHDECPGGVTVERVVQVTSDMLLWIQVRSGDRATANRVLDSVETVGLG
jgi:eukaryotic-like serine/threonine-protein kinase